VKLSSQKVDSCFISSRGCTCSIVVNNCRVVYHGSIDRLNGLIVELRKVYKRLDKGDE
jgi:hypothetical protein